jgi:hypothetical protein
MPNVKLSQVDVLAWLQQNHPGLHAEPDRRWIWISDNLSGGNNKPVREDLKKIGFRFAKNGHTTPSGTLAHWGHHCDAPIPFKRSGGKVDHNKPTREDVLSEIDALLQGVA